MPLQIFDEQFRRRPGRYLAQAALAAVVIALLTGFYPALLDTPVLLAALGASTFLAATIPHSPMTSSRRLVGGYFCGAAVGVGCQWLLTCCGRLDGAFWSSGAMQAALAGLGVAAVLLLMVILDMEHAPAASITLGLVLDHPGAANVLYVLGAIVLLAAVKRVFRPLMIDLW